MRKKKPRKTRRPEPAKPGKKTGKRELLRHAVASNILFSEIHPLTVRSIIPKLTFQTFKNGQTIFGESARGRHLSMILRGRVRISKTTRAGMEPRLALLHEGDFFGELSIIDGLPRSARAEAVGATEIAFLPAAEFRQMIARSPQFASNLLLNMAIRLRTIDQTFVTELERNSTASQAKMDKLRQLIDATRVVNSTIDLDHLLELILDAARLSIRADRGTLYILDEDRRELRARRGQGESHVEITLPVGTGLAGYVAKTGETVNIDDAYSDPRFNPEIDRRSGYRTKTVLCMPMRDKEGKILGVFQLLNKADGAFTPEDESFIAAYSVHASIALNNARLVRAMVEGERLAAVGRMASQIIHDIRNPMAALRIYAETIKRRSDDSGVGEIATQMIKQVDRFVRMAQEILDFSKGVSEMKIDTIAINELVDAGAELFSNELQKRNIEYVRAVEVQGECRVDIEKMIRVFYNIASNAMDAMPDGGTLTQRARLDGKTLVIEFTDTGHGIPEEIRRKILQPFFTAGKKHGTGLGLAITKKIVDDHQGELTILSETGKGTTIRIALPSTG